MRESTALVPDELAVPLPEPESPDLEVRESISARGRPRKTKSWKQQEIDEEDDTLTKRKKR